MTLGLVALSFALAFWQRPGWATSDTKIDLHVDPARFLHQVASVWTPTTDLGEVHSAQYSGYLWPMGPFFSVLHSLGLSPWVVERLWLGLMLALSVWGMLKLLDALFDRRRGVVHLVAASFYLLNPYTVVFSARTTITLLGYAALPWLLLVTHRGLHAARGWRSWWWPAAFALILTSTGGGVNAAVVGWMLVGPLVLALYEPAVGAVPWRRSAGFLVKAAGLGLLASIWWIMPLLVHVRYGIDFLQFTEQPGSIWGTNNATESLRLMGYWTSYIGVGFGVTRPFFSDGATMLFNPLVVGASLLLPALALVSFARARRLTYAPMLLLLVVVGAVIMTAGFPDGTPVRGVMDWIYHNVFVLRFMRTTNKAAPLVAVGFAGLLGLGAQYAYRWLRGLPRVVVRRTALVAAPLALAGVIVLAALPLIRGDALDRQLTWKRIPPAWVAAGRGLDRELPANSRAMVLPGQIFGYYNWGGTLDAILPRLTARPVAVRYETPYADLHAVDLMTTVDDLVQQRRLLPGELAPLLELMGVRAVVSGSDDDISRSGAIDPAAAAAVLAGQGLRVGTRSYGPVRSVPPGAGDIGPPAALPEVRRYDIAPGRGIVHVDPTAFPTVVDGSAQTLGDLAALGALPAHSAVLYAADQAAPALRREASAGANLVIGDSNRRQQFLPQSTQQNLGVVLGAGDPEPSGAAVVNPFAGTGTDAQTVSVLQGVRYLHAPTEPGELQFPEHAATAAFDGDPSTTWVADRYLPTYDRWIEVGLDSPRNIPYVDVYPLSDAHGVVTEVDVNGVHRKVGLGWTRIPLHLHGVTKVRVTIDHVVQPKVGLGGPGGFHEIRIPGVSIHHLLRAPIVIGRALAGADLRHDALTYVFERQTGDEPFKRNPFGTTTVLNDPRDRGDAEQQIDRAVFAPASRSYRIDAWVYPAVQASDPALDRLAGYAGRDIFDSSSRFQDQPAYRASSAFEAGSRSGWVSFWSRPEAPAPWISWATPRPLRVSRLRLTPSPLPVRRPATVELSWPGGSSGPLTVGANGTVVLPTPARARAYRLTVLTAAFPPGSGARQRSAQAIGIGSISVPGLPAPQIPASGALHAPCGTVSALVAGQRVALRPLGSVSELDRGVPLAARGCGSGASVRLPAGIQEIRSLPGPFSVDILRLRSPAPAPVATPPPSRLLAPGRIGTSSVDGVRVSLSRPSWLVLGESYDQGWRATCDGRSLGPPRVLDVYGNGWLAPAGCRQVQFSFAPQNGVRTGYLASILACALMALFLLWGALRRPATADVRPPAGLLPEPVSPRLSLPQAAALALLVAIPLGFMFAIRAGAVSWPLLTFILWRGYGARALALAAAALLGFVVPIAYLITQPNNRGGYNFAYSTELIYAHWFGVAALVLMTLSAWKLMRARPVWRPDPSPLPTLDESEDNGARGVEQEVVGSRPGVSDR